MAKKIKETVKQLKFEDLKVRNVYRSKKPKMIGLFYPEVDDRDILYISQHKSVVGYIDHGYTPEYLEWCNKSALRMPGSEHDRARFESETDKNAKNIETLWDYTVQYDSPSLKNGKKYPFISAAKFLKWAAEDVTEKMPKDKSWATSL